jgi:hypothetical protein
LHPFIYWIIINKRPENFYGGRTLINDAAVNCNVLDFNWDLKSDESEEARFTAIEIKCHESGICKVECPEGGH